MGFSTPTLLCLFVAVFSAGTQCNAQCTVAEMSKIFTCITPHNVQFFDAFVGLGPLCNHSLITSSLCQSFGNIVTCINEQNVSADNCVPNAAGQINPHLQIPCKVEDFFAVCTNVPHLGDKSSTSATTTTTSATTTITTVTTSSSTSTSTTSTAATTTSTGATTTTTSGDYSNSRNCGTVGMPCTLKMLFMIIVFGFLSLISGN